MEEKVLAVVSMLFVFSLITERFSNFLKLWLPEDLDIFGFPERQTAAYYKLRAERKLHKQSQRTSRLLQIVKGEDKNLKERRFLFVGNLKTESTDEFEEKQREAKILLLNIIVGFLVALACKVDVIHIFSKISNTDFSTLIGWKCTNPFTLGNFIGIPLTGFFLSFGSKFWHDAVDLLYETKRLKSRAADPDVIKAGDASAIEKNIEEKNIVEGMLNKNLDFFRSLPGYVDVRITKNPIQNNGLGYAIDVYVSDVNALSTDIPKHFVDPKTRKSIVIEYMDIAAASGGIVEGGGITNATRSDSLGTLGALVWKRKEGNTHNYILSCYHVLKSDTHDLHVFFPHDNGDENIIATGSDQPIAVLERGEISNLFDVGLAKVLEGANVVNDNSFSYCRNLTPLDEQARTQVLIKGAYTKETPAFIHEVARDNITVQYGNKTSVFDDVVLISKLRDGKMVSPAGKGDSGSIVYTAQGEALAMVFAVNRKYTFAMPLNSIMDYLELEFS